MNKWLIADIETAPKPTADLLDMMPEFEAAKNLTDPAKIEKAIQAKRAEWVDECALKAERGRILVCGFLDSSQAQIIEGDERDVLEASWERVREALAGTIIVGHNLIGFDLPFMVRRSWALGVAVPGFVLKDLGQYRAPHWTFDTMLAWTFNNRHERISLDAFAKHLGVGKKNGGGADFAKLYGKDRDKALEYLANDMRLTRDIYLKLNPDMTPTPERKAAI